ncbi:MAG: S-adenosyl-l-methionine hydroxide adenosyltransferase family protein [Clostridia bacterium]|nr:S-adenosyl-l-methionine hydroxide adenosyltransferase family protein [Clostridia bacterium]MBR0443894.1 S-adenosyl-l-methionine hydroxide adenosyltransferase family protein [Clostridia bacterium]
MHALVLQSDFGHADGAVCAMYGVAESIEPTLRIYDLTHEIEPYNIWEASYRLIQTIDYWPEETVFVSVVDPGVGSTRRSIAARTSGNRYIITPDNGTLTHVFRLRGIDSIRVIDETRNRLPYSSEAYTFNGRDVYAFTGARLASGVIRFDEIGPEVPVSSAVILPIMDAQLKEGVITGTIDVLDVRFGSIWTNIPHDLIRSAGIQYGDRVQVSIRNDTRSLYRNVMTFARSFSEVYVGETLAYINSLDYVAVAINQGSFARAYNIGTGNSWQISICKSNL